MRADKLRRTDIRCDYIQRSIRLICSGAARIGGRFVTEYHAPRVLDAILSDRDEHSPPLSPAALPVRRRLAVPSPASRPTCANTPPLAGARSDRSHPADRRSGRSLSTRCRECRTTAAPFRRASQCGGFRRSRRRCSSSGANCDVMLVSDHCSHKNITRTRRAARLAGARTCRSVGRCHRRCGVRLQCARKRPRAGGS